MTIHRRLSDKLVDAHVMACEEKRQDIAEFLLRALELELEILGGYEGEEHRSNELKEKASVRHREAFPESFL